MIDRFWPLWRALHSDQEPRYTVAPKSSRPPPCEHQDDARAGGPDGCLDCVRIGNDAIGFLRFVAYIGRLAHQAVLVAVLHLPSITTPPPSTSCACRTTTPSAWIICQLKPKAWYIQSTSAGASR